MQQGAAQQIFLILLASQAKAETIAQAELVKQDLSNSENFLNVKFGTIFTSIGH